MQNNSQHTGLRLKAGHVEVVLGVAGQHFGVVVSVEGLETVLRPAQEVAQVEGVAVLLLGRRSQRLACMNLS